LNPCRAAIDAAVKRLAHGLRRHTRKSAGYYSLAGLRGKGLCLWCQFAHPWKSNHLVEEARLLGPVFPEGRRWFIFCD